MADEHSRRTDTQAGLDAMLLAGEETPILFRPLVIACIVAGFLALAGLYFAVTYIWDISLEIDAEPFQDWVESLGFWGPIAYIGVMAAATLFAPIPNVPVFIAAGLAWGPVLGTVYSLIGQIIGSAAAFWVARKLGRRWLPRLVGRKTAARVDSLADSMGGTVVFLARMLPVLNFDWLSFVAGVTSIRFWVFIVASALGMIVPTAAAVAAGDGLGRDLRITVIAIGAWLGTVVLCVAYAWWRRRKHLNGTRNGAAVTPATPSTDVNAPTAP